MKDFKTPVTYIKQRHPDYVRVTLKQSAAIKQAITEKYGSVIGFSKEHDFVSYSSLCNYLSGSQKVCPKKLKKILAALELGETA